MAERGQGGLLSSLLSTPGKLLATPGKLLGWQRQAKTSSAAQRAEASGAHSTVLLCLMLWYVPLLTLRPMCTRAGDASSENAEQKQEKASSVAKPEQPVPAQRPQTQTLQVGMCFFYMHTAWGCWLGDLQQRLAARTPDAAVVSSCLQETKAEHSPAASALQLGLERTMLQGTSGWESNKHAALERFFSRPPMEAGTAGGMQRRTAGKPQTAVYGAFYDIMSNTRGAGSAAARDPENGPLRHATRTSRYNPYARPQARTGAGHVNR